MSAIRNEYGKTWALVQEIADLQEEIKREREKRVIILYRDIRAGTNLLARHDAGIQQLEKRLKELETRHHRRAANIKIVDRWGNEADILLRERFPSLGARTKIEDIATVYPVWDWPVFSRPVIGTGILSP